MSSRMRTLRYTALAVVIGLLLMPLSKTASTEAIELEIVTASFAPLQMDVDGEVKGYVVDLVNLALKRVQDEIDLTIKGPRIVPWRRAMATAEKKPNTMFFSLSRTPGREDKFIWVAEVSPYEVYLYKLTENQNVEGTSLPALLENQTRIGVQANSNAQELMESTGFVKGHNFVTYGHFSDGIKMLFKKRFAMLPLTISVGKASVCRQGFDAEAVEPTIKLDALSNPLWLVFSKGSDERLIELFTTAINDLKRSKMDVAYRESYLADWQRESCGS